MSDRIRRGRGWGEGAVYSRPEVDPAMGKTRERWCAVLSLGHDDQGKRKRRVFYGWTKKEATDKMQKALGAAAAGPLPDPDRETVASYMRRWLKTTAKTRLRDSSLARYEKLTELHMLPVIGGVRLSSLRPEHIEAMQASMVDKKLSTRTREFAHAVLRKALHDAMKARRLLGNPCDAVARPKPKRPEMKVWDAEQAKAFLRATAGDRFEPAYALAITCGLREGEILGLQWSAIDLERASLSVVQTVGMVRGKITHGGEPKTKQGRRRVELSASVVKGLREHRKRLLAFGHGGSPWVFPNAKDGGPTRPDVLVDHFKTIRDGVDLGEGERLPKIRFHDLRHTAATLQLLQGTHPKVVQERLGHATISITLDTYSHVVPSMQREAAAKMDELVGEAIGGEWLHGGFIQAKKQRRGKVEKLRKDKR